MATNQSFASKIHEVGKRSHKENGDEDVDTLLGKMKRAAFREGLEQGIEKGIARGKAEGKAESLVKLLNSRFESVPQNVIERVRRATIADLEA